MIAKLILRFKSPFGEALDSFCDRCPLISSVILQLAAAVFLIGAVAFIAVAGGSVIWIVYHLVGLM